MPRSYMVLPSTVPARLGDGPGADGLPVQGLRKWPVVRLGSIQRPEGIALCTRNSDGFGGLVLMLQREVGQVRTCCALERVLTGCSRTRGATRPSDSPPSSGPRLPAWIRTRASRAGLRA